MIKQFAILLSFLVIFMFAEAQDAQHVFKMIIPKPVLIKEKNGQFTIKKTTIIGYNKGAANSAHFLADLLSKSLAYEMKPIHSSISDKKNAIYFFIDKNMPDTTNGAYTLEVSNDQIIAKAANDNGLFYAVQTIRQLLPATVESINTSALTQFIIPAVSIKDAPRYGWRGYMKDVSRTFYSVDVIKKYLDIMALYKLNTFHFHLTDDQGWRIELKKHPEMTSAPVTVFKASSEQPSYRSGFYTQAQIRDIVSYAMQRHINIVPEIDVPGHCWPITIAHPELCVNQKNIPDSVVSFMDSYNYWGYQYTPNPLDPSKEEVYEFLDDVFTEVADLFPHKYIHFGGDEVKHVLWEKTPQIQEFMKIHGMKKIEEVQSYFVQRVSKIITAKGKRPVGWNDILADADNLPKSTVIMSWLGGNAVKQAAKYNFYTVATPTAPLYFDISQDDINDGTMVDWNYGGGNGEDGGGNTLLKVYAYDPEQGLSENERKYVLGVQANMWPAVPQELKDINVQNFPRMIALAEIAWTQPRNKDYINFLSRLYNHYPRLDSLRVDYFKKGGYIIAKWDSSAVSTSFKNLQWDITSKVYTTGRAQAGFLYTGGKSFLKIRNVKLLENDKVVASDDHLSVADNFRGTPFKKNMFYYVLQLKSYNPRAKYILRAEVAAEKAETTNGNVTFNLSPDKPFFTVESLK